LALLLAYGVGEAAVATEVKNTIDINEASINFNLHSLLHLNVLIDIINPTINQSTKIIPVRPQLPIFCQPLVMQMNQVGILIACLVLTI
jgi:hypothetical protein